MSIRNGSPASTRWPRRTPVKATSLSPMRTSAPSGVTTHDEPLRLSSSAVSMSTTAAAWVTVTTSCRMDTSGHLRLDNDGQVRPGGARPDLCDVRLEHVAGDERDD